MCSDIGFELHAFDRDLLRFSDACNHTSFCMIGDEAAPPLKSAAPLVPSVKAAVQCDSVWSPGAFLADSGGLAAPRVDEDRDVELLLFLDEECGRDAAARSTRAYQDMDAFLGRYEAHRDPNAA